MKRAAAYAMLTVAAFVVAGMVAVIVLEAMRGSALAGIVATTIAASAIGHGAIWAFGELRKESA